MRIITTFLAFAVRIIRRLRLLFPPKPPPWHRAKPAQSAQDIATLDTRTGRTKPEWVHHEVLYLATHLPSCRRVAFAFNRQHGWRMTVGKTWVAEQLKAHADEIASLRRERRRRAPAVFEVNHTWALDLTFHRLDESSNMATMLGIIDHGSRKLLCLKRLPAKCVFTLLGHLLLAMAEFGRPRAIRTDNEAMFTSNLWRWCLQRLGVAHRRGPPAQPWRNGRIERLFGTLKPLLRQRAWTNPAQLNWALAAFTDFYNRNRPHQSLGGLTPQEAWNGTAMGEVQALNARAPTPSAGPDGQEANPSTFNHHARELSASRRVRHVRPVLAGARTGNSPAACCRNATKNWRTDGPRAQQTAGNET